MSDLTPKSPDELVREMDRRQREEQSRARVLAEVSAERVRQDEKWQEQNYPDGTGGAYFAMHAGISRRLCQEAFANGTGTWVDILNEEVDEAFAESDPVKLRAELIQVAAVAVSWVQAIDRRKVDTP